MKVRHNPSPRVVVVTGASAGVGRAVVREFARRGDHIGLLARGKDGLDAAYEEVLDFGGKACTVSVDMSDPEAVEAAAAKVEQELGPIDVWVNNAMVTVFSRFSELSPEEFHRVTAVTYLGYVHGTMAALKRMRPRNRGVVVQVSSALAYRSIPLQSAYCGAKHAIKGFTDSIRSELLHESSEVRLTEVQLPAVNTPQFSWARNHMDYRPQPVPPIFQPEVAARAIEWASRHKRRQVSVGAPTLLALWAQKLAPGLADRYLGMTGYRGQQVREQLDPGDRPDNLFEALPGDMGAHGRFDEEARDFSGALWMVQNRTWLVPAGLAAAALIWSVARRR